MAKYNVTPKQKEQNIKSVVCATQDGTLIGSQGEVLTKTQTIIGTIDLSGSYLVPLAVSSADVLNDVAPSDPGTFPGLQHFYVADRDNENRVTPGSLIVWIPTNHNLVPAQYGWRYFADVSTCVKLFLPVWANR
jgi:hypothetical protein